MSQSLEVQATRMLNLLESSGIVVFHGLSRLLDDIPMVHWDTTRYPEFNSFVQAAKQVESKVVVVHTRDFLPEHVEEAEFRLENAQIDYEDRQDYEKLVKSLHRHIGEVCLVEASFDWQGRIYLYTLETDWYESLSDMMTDLELCSPSQTQSRYPGDFFSKN